MYDSGTFPGLIDSFYQAAIEPPHWPQALERLADAFGADGATLANFDQITGHGPLINARVDPAAVPVYVGYFAGRNSIRPRRNRVLALGRDPVRWRTIVLNDEHALPKSELMRSEYYADFLWPFGMHSLLMVGLSLHGTKFASLSLRRGARRNQFDDSEVKIAATLQSHFIRAFALAEKLSDMQQEYAGMASFLDRCMHALFLTDVSGRVSYRNRAGDALLVGGGGLALRAGRISVSEANGERKLTAAIARASETGSGATFALARPGRRELAVIVAPMRSEQLIACTSGPRVMVCVSDPETGVVPPAQHLRQLYALTPAEAKIAVELLSGGEPKRIAERLALSIHTVRVHLARILTKTDTSRQADLVRLLARVCGMWMDFPEPAPIRKN